MLAQQASRRGQPLANGRDRQRCTGDNPLRGIRQRVHALRVRSSPTRLIIKLWMSLKANLWQPAIVSSIVHRMGADSYSWSLLSIVICQNAYAIGAPDSFRNNSCPV